MILTTVANEYVVYTVYFLLFEDAAVALGILFAFSFITLIICCFAVVCCRQSQKVKYTALPTS